MNNLLVSTAIVNNINLIFKTLEKNYLNNYDLKIVHFHCHGCHLQVISFCRKIYVSFSFKKTNASSS